MNTNDQHDRFVRILEEHEPGKKLGHAWNLICRAAEIGWIQEEDIEEIIDCGLDFGVEGMSHALLAGAIARGPITIVRPTQALTPTPRAPPADAATYVGARLRPVGRGDCGRVPVRTVSYDATC